MISSLLNVYYLLSIPIRGFFGQTPETPRRYSNPQPDGEIHEAPAMCLIAISVTTVGCLVLFFYSEPVYDLLKQLVLP
jgi:multicomponent Na+:H+ antiporter subunit D